MQNRVESKVVILTGAGNGIGLALTKLLLRESSISLVVGVDIKASKLEELIPSSNGKLMVISGSIADRATSEQAIRAAVETKGRVDSIILNAGILKPVGRLADTAVVDWKKLFDVNFFGLLHTIQLALPELRKTQGQILITSSGVSQKPMPAWIAYSCSKAAANWLCACLPQEEDQVRVLCVTPGIVDTGMQAQVRAEHESDLPEWQYKWLNDLHSQEGLLRPEQPASTFARLVVQGIPEELNGQVVGWDDERVAAKS